MLKDIFTQLKQKYTKGGIIEKLIFINVGIFILTFFIDGISSLFNSSNSFFWTWFALPSNIYGFIFKPWTIVTYGFLHGGFFHLVFNMIYLYVFGRLFLNYFIPRKLLDFYLLGTICGGVLFLLTYNYFPALQNSNTILVGASAGVMAILAGTTAYIPNHQFNFTFIGPVKLWVIAAIFIGIDLISIGNNAGTTFSHLGGALYGFLAIYYKDSFQLKNPFKKVFTKKTPLKTSYKTNRKNNTKTDKPQSVQDKIDVILDKISKSGYESLSKEEKAFLFQQGKK